MKYLTDLDGILTINNSALSKDEKSIAKKQYLNEAFDSLSGNHNEKFLIFGWSLLDIDYFAPDHIKSISWVDQFENLILNKEFAIIEWLLSKDAGIKYYAYPHLGFSSLHLAAGIHQSEETVKLLLQQNIDINTLSTSSANDTKFGNLNEGSTALSEAVRCGNFNIVEILLATNQVTPNTSMKAYELAKEIAILIKTNTTKLSSYIGSARMGDLSNYSNQIQNILEYLKNFKISFMLTQQGLNSKDVPKDISNQINSFIYYPGMLFMLKSIESKIIDHRIADDEKRLFDLFFARSQQDLNHAAVFEQYVANHGGDKRKAGALTLKP